MNLSNYYWYFKSALTPRFCDEVIKQGLQQKEATALLVLKDGLEILIKNL